MATHQSKKVIYTALIGNNLIAIYKFVAATVTGSSAMFSESIHSAVASCNQLLLPHGIRKSQVDTINEPPTIHPGSNGILLNVRLDLVDGVTSQDVELATSEIEREVKYERSAVRRAFIEAQSVVGYREVQLNT